jgi:hypothetical protein
METDADHLDLEVNASHAVIMKRLLALHAMLVHDSLAASRERRNSGMPQ